jgi:hypothetical protein
MPCGLGFLSYDAGQAPPGRQAIISQQFLGYLGHLFGTALAMQTAHLKPVEQDFCQLITLAI